MRRSCSGRLASLIAVLAVAGFAHPAIAEQRGECDLYLETIINGVPTGLIGAYRQRAGGGLAITADELNEVGLLPEGAAAASDGMIDLDRLTGVSYRYDPVHQAIRFDVAESRRATRIYDARAAMAGHPSPPTETAQPGYGVVLSYHLFGTTDAGFGDPFSLSKGHQAASASLEARVFSPFGVLSQSGAVTASPDTQFDSIRLDTTWTYSDPSSLITYRAGDLISSGLPWTRSVRLGGVQIQRSFALRPDLVTMPVPQLAGSAAVPSTLDVYVNNIRTFSQNLAAGPFEESAIFPWSPARARSASSYAMRRAARQSPINRITRRRSCFGRACSISRWKLGQGA